MNILENLNVWNVKLGLSKCDVSTEDRVSLVRESQRKQGGVGDDFSDRVAIQWDLEGWRQHVQRGGLAASTCRVKQCTGSRDAK